MTQPGDYKIYEDLSRLNNELAAAHRELAQKNGALFLEHETLRVTLLSMRNGVVSTDTDSRITLINPAALALTGWELRECMGQPFDLVFPVLREKTETPLSGFISRVLAADTVLTTTDDLALRAPGGNLVPIELSCAPITDQSGDRRGVIIIIRDVTLQRQMTEELRRLVRERTYELEAEIQLRKGSEEVIRAALVEKEVLLHELHHRVKNNLQIIISMLSLQARKMKDPALQQAIKESQNRVRTMAVVHEKLWTEADLARIDLKSYIRYLTSSLFTLYQVKPGAITLTLEIPDCVVDINTAIPLGLILNELIANSLRHAFPGGRRGEVMLTVRDEGGSLLIDCGDNGVGMPPGYDWENPDTVGLIFVHSLVRQLQGTIKKLPGEGTHFTIMVRKPSDGGGPVRGTYNTVPDLAPK